MEGNPILVCGEIPWPFFSTVQRLLELKGLGQDPQDGHQGDEEDDVFGPQRQKSEPEEAGIAFIAQDLAPRQMEVKKEGEEGGRAKDQIPQVKDEKEGEQAVPHPFFAPAYRH